MRDHPRSSRALTRAGTVVAVVVGLMAIYSCSLIVETRSQQCQAESDCTAMFPGSHCDMTSGLCVGKGSGSSSSGSGSSGSSSSGSMSCDVDGGIKGGGCYNCTANTGDQLLNHCTDGCIQFDNTRVTKLPDGGMLPSLPSPGPDGGM